MVGGPFVSKTVEAAPVVKENWKGKDLLLVSSFLYSYSALLSENTEWKTQNLPYGGYQNIWGIDVGLH